VYETARKLGAIGGKLSGAGGGGFMQLYCPFDKKHRIAERLREMGCTVSDVAFTHQGVQTWVVRY
jgi:D-glycero-alpha-D-manno-heptose-7-phosphate kinase